MSDDLYRHSGALYSPATSTVGVPPPPHQQQQQPIIPRWSRSRSIASTTSSRRRKRGKLYRGKRNVRRLQKWVRKKVAGLTVMQKVLGVLVLMVGVVLGVLMLVFHRQILHGIMEPVAIKLRSWKAGWLLIFLLCFISAFPPLIGYSTAVTLSGFVYGFPTGWYIISTATVLGATAAFITSRHFFRNFAQRMVATDRRFAALALTLQHDGVKLLCMIRLCPLPYSISNGALSTFPTVSPWAFMAATALASPKLLIHVWIGARLAVLAEQDEDKMDAKTKAINYGSIIFGIILGIGTGWIIYKRTLKRAHQLELEERAKLAAEAATNRRRSGDVPPYSDVDDDDDVGGVRDVEAAETAELITGLIEGEGMGVADLFRDLEEDEEDAVEQELLEDETSEEEGERPVLLVQRESTGVGGKGRGGRDVPESQGKRDSGPLL